MDLTMKIELHLLDQIRVASPCPTRWEEMTGDDRIRYCTLCSKHVYRFEGMSRSEIVRLLKETEHEICAQLARRADGSLITNDCPVGVEKAKRRRRLAVLLALLPIALFGAALGGGYTLHLATRQPLCQEGDAAWPRDFAELWEETLVTFGLKRPRVTTLGGCVAPPPGTFTPPASGGETSK